MDLNWLQSILMGIVSGLTNVLPVSAEAHVRLMRKSLGVSQTPELMELMIHLGIFAALYLSCQNHILKMVRAKKLSRIPKRKRKRPLDTRSLMDLSLWQTMLLPVIILLFFYQKITGLVGNLILMATFLFLNGLILYIPQYLPSSNKDCRSLSRVEGLLMGLAGAMFVVPGMSGTGAALSVASVTGVDRKYGLNMVLLMNLGILAGKMIYDLLAVISAGFAGIGFVMLLRYITAGLAAFLGAFAAVKILRHQAEEKGYALYSYYCWAIALFTFVLSLMA